METRTVLIKDDLDFLLNELKRMPKFNDRQLICNLKTYNKFFRTKLPRKLKKRNKKLGIMNLSINYTPNIPANEIYCNIGFEISSNNSIN